MITRLAHTSRKIRYTLGLTVAAVIVLLHFWLSAWSGARLPFLLFIGALGLTSLLLGTGPAVIILIAGAFYAAWVLPPGGSLSIHTQADQVAMLVYLSFGLVFVYVGRKITLMTRGAAAVSAALQETKLAIASQAAEAQLQFHTVLDSAAVPFWVMAPVDNGLGQIINFRWDYLNSAAATVIQRTSGDTVGGTLDLLAGDGWDTGALLVKFAACVSARQPIRFDFRVNEASRESWYDIIVSPLNGDVAVWLADITYRKRHEAQLEEADRRKDEFLATLAHELRNPLAPIRQATELFRSENLAADKKQWCIDVIDRHSRKLSLLLDGLLDVSRITHSKITLRKEPVPLHILFDEAEETVSAVMQQQRHTLRVQLPETPLTLCVDQLRIGQVLVNLLRNAAKFTPPGGLIVLSAVKHEDGLILEITDNGVGIEPPFLLQIFDLFTQVKPDGDAEGGLGIGLALSKRLIELHGGLITAGSLGKGRGSQFRIFLPDAVYAIGEVAALDYASPKSRSSGKLLVVDDNRDAADAMAALMELDGRDVMVGYGGKDALAMYEAFRPGIVILDLGMPDMGGLEVAREIRRSRHGAAITLIAATGWGQAHDRAQSRAAGFDHHFTKPVDMTLLRATLADIEETMSDTGPVRVA